MIAFPLALFLLWIAARGRLGIYYDYAARTVPKAQG